MVLKKLVWWYEISAHVYLVMCLRELQSVQSATVIKN